MSFPRSTSILLIVVYSASAGVVPKGISSQRKVILSTIEIQVEVVLYFTYIRR